MNTMKQISIAFCAPSLTLPINYHHEVQSLIYRLLRGDDVHLHDEGAGSRQYKLFTFSSLRGCHTAENKRITFEEMIYLDIRSVRNRLCNSIEATLKEAPVPALALCGQPLTLRFLKTEERMIADSQLLIRMLSPLEVHAADETYRNHSHYYTPLDKDFSERINANFQRKWTAYTGNPPVGGIELTAANVSAKDKYVTTYKGIHITGWRGEYRLSGNPEHLHFLYHCGLGARNSDGFGMFEII